jgi:hypothetical protein
VARSFNHCCSGKVINHTYSVYMVVDLVIHHAVRVHLIVICALPCPALQFFPHISYKARFSKTSNIELKLCVLVFETFIILSRMENVSNNLNIKNRYSCHILMNFEYSGRVFQKVLKYQILRKIFLWGTDLFHDDRQTKRRTEMT